MIDPALHITARRYPNNALDILRDTGTKNSVLRLPDGRLFIGTPYFLTAVSEKDWQGHLRKCVGMTDDIPIGHMTNIYYNSRKKRYEPNVPSIDKTVRDCWDTENIAEYVTTLELQTFVFDKPVPSILQVYHYKKGYVYYPQRYFDFIQKQYRVTNLTLYAGYATHIVTKHGDLLGWVAPAMILPTEEVFKKLSSKEMTLTQADGMFDKYCKDYKL